MDENLNIILETLKKAHSLADLQGTKDKIAGASDWLVIKMAELDVLRQSRFNWDLMDSDSFDEL